MDCCSEKLSGAKILIGNSTNGLTNAICGKVGSSSGVSRIEITCPKELPGRYVTIVAQPNTVLSLCEVEVMKKSK